MKIKNVLEKIPQTPGIYTFKDRRGRFLYVGKTANLRARIGSYLRPGWKESMIKEAASIDWKELSSDVEALIQESILIKNRKPKYNIIFRDDKNYFYVAITREKFPRLYLTHQPFNSAQGKSSTISQKSKIKNQADYVGPFTDGNSLKDVLRLLRKIFPYCTCSSYILHKRKCVNAEIGKCLGYCCTATSYAYVDQKQYLANIRSIREVLTGRMQKLKDGLTKEMKKLSEKRHYEKAAKIRDDIESLDYIFKHSPYLKREIGEERIRALRSLKEFLGLHKVPHRIEGYDISHHQGAASVASMVVFENGLPKKSDYRKFIMRRILGINDPAMIYEVLTRRLKHTEWTVPDFVLVDGGKGQLSSALLALKSSRIKAAALAKREEELYLPSRKEPLRIRNLPPPLFYLLTNIRDEAHRFAISFHRKRSAKKLFAAG